MKSKARLLKNFKKIGLDTAKVFFKQDVEDLVRTDLEENDS
jgi:hypothetical protein